MAQEAARTAGHNYIGPEHLLIGMAKIEDGIAARALRSYDVTDDKLFAAMTEMHGPRSGALHGHIPFTPSAKKVLEYALREALQLGHTYIGTEHLLLAVVRFVERDDDETTTIAQLTKKVGLAPAVLRQETIMIMVGDEGSTEAARAGRLNRERQERMLDIVEAMHDAPLETLKAAAAVFEAEPRHITAINALLDKDG